MSDTFDTIELYEDPEMDWRQSYQEMTHELHRTYLNAFYGKHGYRPVEASDDFQGLLGAARETARKRVEKAIKMHDESQRAG